VLKRTQAVPYSIPTFFLKPSLQSKSEGRRGRGVYAVSEYLKRNAETGQISRKFVRKMCGQFLRQTTGGNAGICRKMKNDAKYVGLGASKILD